MKVPSRKYSKAELQFVERRKGLTRRELHAAFLERFRRTDVSIGNLQYICKTRGWFTGRTDGPFKNGNIPFMKGRKRPPDPNQDKNLNKKGMRYASPGNEKIHPYGYILITAERAGVLKYVSKHKLLWEQTNGPVPKGMVLKCLDGDKQNTDPSNWECVPTGVLSRLRKRCFENAPPELKPTIIAVAKLEHTAASKGK